MTLLPTDTLTEHVQWVAHDAGLELSQAAIDVAASLARVKASAVYFLPSAQSVPTPGKFRIEDIGTEMERLEKGQAIRQQGQYNAAGVTSSIAGKGFNLGLPDDVMSEQDKDSKDKKNDKEIPPSVSEKLKDMKISEEKARMVLEAMKNQEVQYLQQNKRKATKPKGKGKPDW